MLSARAASSISRWTSGADGRLTSTDTRVAEGAASWSSCTYLPPTPEALKVSPVMLPPGRARLVTSPAATRSGATMVTMGIVVVARRAAAISRVPVTTMTFTCRSTSSAANSVTRGSFPAAKRRSITMFWPSTYPSARRPPRNAVHCGPGRAGSVPIDRRPMRGVLAGAWASAATATHSRTASATAAHADRRLIVRLPGRSGLYASAEALVPGGRLALFALPPFSG